MRDAPGDFCDLSYDASAFPLSLSGEVFPRWIQNHDIFPRDNCGNLWAVSRDEMYSFIEPTSVK